MQKKWNLVMRKANSTECAMTMIENLHQKQSMASKKPVLSGHTWNCCGKR